VGLPQPSEPLLLALCGTKGGSQMKITDASFGLMPALTRKGT
jgi:hypothetical protein